MATPSFLQAQPGGHEVVLSWGSAPGAVTYELFWDTQPGVAATDESFTNIAATEFMHSGLSKDTTYYYRVRARNAGGASSLSQEVSAELVPQSCGLDGECPSGFCRDGYCCDSDCAGVCQSCDGAENSDGGNGFCSNMTYGNTDTAPTALCDSSGTGCVTDDCACDDAGSCLGTTTSTTCTNGAQSLSGSCPSGSCQ